MRKYGISLICALIVITSFTKDVSAINPDSYVKTEGIELSAPSTPTDIFSSNKEFSCGKPLISDELDEKIETYKEEEANMAEKFVTGQAQNLYKAFDINGLYTLVFGNPYCVWGTSWTETNTMAADGVFTVEEREKIINPLLKLFGSSFGLILLLSMLIRGLKTMGTSIRGRAMDEFWTDVGWWFGTVFLFYLYGWWTNILFQLNAAVVLSIRDLINVDTDGLSLIANANDAKMAVGPFLVVMMAEWVLAVILNLIYLARKVILTLLLVLGFVAIYSLLFAKTRAFFGTWLRELIGNIFLQSIHSIILFAMIMYSQTAGTFFKLGLMMMFIPVAGMISKWLNIGDSSSKLGSALTYAGLGGVASTAMLFSQAGTIMRGGSIANYGGSAFNSSSSTFGGNSLSDLSNSMANDSLSTSISSRALGQHSSFFNMGKSAAGKMGAIVGGGAGLVLGPVGAALGAKTGQAVGEGIVQSGRNLVSGVGSIISTAKEGKKFVGENGTGFKALFADKTGSEALNTRRQLMGNFGESLGVILGGQKGAEMGRKVGFSLSGVSRQRLSNAMSASQGIVNANGNPQPLTFEALSQKYPNADMKWLQTNQGSAFFVNTANGWKQVGLTGAADKTLATGQTRVMDYKLSDPSMNYEYQPNGTYKAPMTLSEAAISGNSVVPMSNSVPTFDEALTSGQVGSVLGSVQIPSDASSSTTATIATSNTTNPMEKVASSPAVENANNSMKTVGLAGSTPSVMRTSDAYVVTSDTKGVLNAQVAAKVTSPNVVRQQDLGFNSKQVNPDAYVYHNVQGVKNYTGTDMAANTIHKTSKVYSAWKVKAAEQKMRIRGKKVV